MSERKGLHAIADEMIAESERASDTVCGIFNPFTGKNCTLHRHDHTHQQLEDCWINREINERAESATRGLVGEGRISVRVGRDTFLTSSKDSEGDNAESWDECRSWICGGKKGLYLWGPPGTGKTFAARSVLYAAILDGMSVFEITAQRMCSVHKRYDADDIRANLSRSKILLIDDIDKPVWNKDDLSYFWEMMNDRADYGNRTIITSNLAPQNLRSIFSDAAVGNVSKVDAALERMAPTVTVEFKGKSLRGKNAG